MLFYKYQALMYLRDFGTQIASLCFTNNPGTINNEKCHIRTVGKYDGYTHTYNSVSGFHHPRHRHISHCAP